MLGRIGSAANRDAKRPRHQLSEVIVHLFLARVKDGDDKERTSVI